jgi:tetratricopeptide (TPR) repeat protein
MIWRQRVQAQQPPGHRLKVLVQEVRDRPATVAVAAAESGEEWPDVAALLAELRSVARRGGEPTAAKRLGAEFTRSLKEFYALPSDIQPAAIEAMLLSAQREREGDLAGAIAICEASLKNVPGYPPLLERLARLQTQLGDPAGAERWYEALLQESLDRGQPGLGIEVCYRVLETEVQSLELLRLCGILLEACDDYPLAANCWSRRASRLVADGRHQEAFQDLDRAIAIQPDSAHLVYELAELWEKMGEHDRANAAFAHCASLANDDPETLARVLLKQAVGERPDVQALGRLMDLLEARPLARANALQRCAGAVSKHPYVPHLRFIQGVLLAQDGQIEPATAALRIAIERYSATADTASELEARLSLQQLDPFDRENYRRAAAIHFERGEVKSAMQVLAGLARVTRKAS